MRTIAHAHTLAQHQNTFASTSTTSETQTIVCTGPHEQQLERTPPILRPCNCDDRSGAGGDKLDKPSPPPTVEFPGLNARFMLAVEAGANGLLSKDVLPVAPKDGPVVGDRSKMSKGFNSTLARCVPWAWACDRNKPAPTDDEANKSSSSAVELLVLLPLELPVLLLLLPLPLVPLVSLLALPLLLLLLLDAGPLPLVLVIAAEVVPVLPVAPAPISMPKRLGGKLPVSSPVALPVEDRSGAGAPMVPIAEGVNGLRACSCCRPCAEIDISPNCNGPTTDIQKHHRHDKMATMIAWSSQSDQHTKHTRTC
jgi:hypothetical protein